jgi:hypothetical protein
MFGFSRRRVWGRDQLPGAKKQTKSHESSFAEVTGMKLFSSACSYGFMCRCQNPPRAPKGNVRAEEFTYYLGPCPYFITQL